MTHPNHHGPALRPLHSSSHNQVLNNPGVMPHVINNIDHGSLRHKIYGDDYFSANELHFDFWKSVQILWRRKWMILAIIFIGLALATMTTLRVTPKFKAHATIEIQRQESQIIEGGSIEPAVIADSDHMATQYELLRSRSLAERVAEVLDLPSDGRYANQSLSRPVRLEEATGSILDNLRVFPAGSSRIVMVEFISPYPREAARISNALVDNFIKTNLERKYNATAFARQFLAERIVTTKAALEDTERRLVEYAAENDIFDLSSGNEGISLNANLLISLNQDLAKAESERINLEQVFVEAKSNSVTRQMLESDDMGRLRTERSILNAEYQENLGVFKPAYPDMVKLQARIDAFDKEIKNQQENVLVVIEADYRAAQAQERSLKNRVVELKSELQDLRGRRIEYTILKREVNTNRAQYDALLQRMKQVSITSGVGSNQVSIVDRAIEPKLPFEPNLMRTLLQALILSLVFGVGLTFLLNYIDDTIKTPDDVKQKLGLAVIGVIPKVKGKEGMLIDELQDSKSMYSEAIFSARTALEFSSSEGVPKSIAITSTNPNEGKTSTAISLAIAFAKVGKKVLIIDGDMRKPSFLSNPDSSIGLSGLLSSDAVIKDNVVKSDTNGLFLIPAGIIPPNPSELLSSPRLKYIVEEAEQMFDLVIVDSPPVLSFADAPLIGSICRATLVVVHSGTIRSPMVSRTIGRVQESFSNVLGIILTKFDAKKIGYDYASYGYYGKGAYSYGEIKTEKGHQNTNLKKIKIFTNQVTDDKTSL